MSLKTHQLRSLIDTKRKLVSYHNERTVNLTLFHEQQETHSLYITLTKGEVRSMIDMLNMYLAEMEGGKLPSRGVTTDSEIIEKFKQRVTL